MTEILTESFCERCGTRYTFESAAPKRPRLRGLKVIGRGLKNFVLSDDSSLDEALAAARSEAEYEVTTHQLDAFHRTFNFCMTCRQYTCENCWDPVEARCLTCAPDGEKARAVAAAEAAAAAAAEAEAARAKAMIGTWPVAEFINDEVGPETVEPGALDALLAKTPEAESPDAGSLEAPAAPEDVAEVEIGAVRSEPPTDEIAPPVEPETAPAAALEVAAALEGEAETVSAGTVPAPAESAVAEPAAAEPEAAVAPAPDVAAPSEEPLPPAAADAAPAEEMTAPAAEAPAVPAPLSAPPAAPAQPPYQRSIRRYRPGQSLDDEIAAYEAGLAAGLSRSLEVAPPASPPTPVLAEAMPIEPAAAEIEAPTVAPEPVVAEAAPIEAAAPVAPEPSTTPEPPAVTTAPIPSVTPPPFTPPVSRPSGPPAWPTGTRWPTAPTAPTVRDSSTGSPVVDPLAAALARRATDAMWAQSATELLQAQPVPVAPTAPVAGVQSCQNCGLSLSATARFCRRCGTRQEG